MAHEIVGYWSRLRLPVLRCRFCRYQGLEDQVEQHERAHHLAELQALQVFEQVAAQTAEFGQGTFGSGTPVVLHGETEVLPRVSVDDADAPHQDAESPDGPAESADDEGEES